ncbi:MAG: biotin synthase BioB, partial [Armatimonadota bacterium]
DILRAAKEAAAHGAERFDVVVSGADPGGDFDAICEALADVRAQTGLNTCASLGALTRAQARQLREAGVTRYNHNVETARARYAEIVSTHPYQRRLETIRIVKEEGLELCCGCIIGMGESPEERVDLALELRALEPDCVPINVLNPIVGTPLEGTPPLPPLEIIRTIAMFRFVMPDVTLKYGGGRERNLRDLQALGMVAGVNGLILGNYLTTLGRPPEQDLQMIRDLGLEADA